MPGLWPTSISRFGSVAEAHADDSQQLRRDRRRRVPAQFDLRLRRAVLHRLPGDVPGLHAPAPPCETSTWSGKRRMRADPAADLGGILVAALVEPAVLVAAGRRVGFGLGVTQQHQTAHGSNLNSFRRPWINVQASVPGQGDKQRERSVRKRHERDFHKRDHGPDAAASRSRAAVLRSGRRHLRGRGRACRADGRAGGGAAGRQRRGARRPACRLERLRQPARHGDAGLMVCRSPI